jgi:hypothetical protein
VTQEYVKMSDHKFAYQLLGVAASSCRNGMNNLKFSLILKFADHDEPLLLDVSNVQQDAKISSTHTCTLFHCYSIKMSLVMPLHVELRGCTI